MPELLRLDAPIELQAAADSTKPPTISILAYAGGIIVVPKGWGRVVIDLRGLDASGQVPILIDHDASLQGIVGHGTASTTNGQLLVSGSVPQVNDAARQVVERAKAGFVWQASVGVEPTQTETIRAGSEVSVNSRTIKADGRPFQLVKRGRLREVSIVGIGADPNSAVSIAASSRGNQRMSTENQDVQTPDEIKSAWDQPGLSNSERVLARFRGATFHGRNARERVEEKMVQAVAGEMTFDQFDKEILHAENYDLREKMLNESRPQAPAIHGSNRDQGPKVMEAAFAQTVGLGDVERHYKAETLEASDRYRGVGLQELLLAAANENGYTGRQRVGPGNVREVLQAAFLQASSPSTHTMSGVLSNVANKVLLEGFEHTEQVWKAISRTTRPLNDFKVSTRYRMTDQLEYEEVGPAGEIKHGTAGEESYTLQAKTYAKMLGLTRQDIVNDDVGVFDTLKEKLGRGAGLALNRVFWTAFLDDAAFFTTARGNLLEGAAGVLADDPDSLDAAVLAFGSLVDANGAPLGVAPKIVLCPPALAAVAKRLHVSTEVRNTTASTQYAVANAYQGAYTPHVSSYLSSSAITGNSATGWYLLADPAVLPVMEVGFLDGKQSPTVESADADFNTLGIQFRGYHDFGVAQAEWRAGVKSDGAD